MPNIAVVTNVKRKHIERERRMKHKHSKMISEKVNNMDLVVCINNYGKWEFGDLSRLVDLDAFPAFLCLLKHKDECLHWLNGGDVIILDFPDDEIERVLTSEAYSGWHNETVFMSESVKIRIKPKKEKRWITYHKDGFVFDRVSSSKSELKIALQEHELSDYVASDWQFIEIEVEVNEKRT